LPSSTNVLSIRATNEANWPRSVRPLGLNVRVPVPRTHPASAAASMLASWVLPLSSSNEFGPAGRSCPVPISYARTSSDASSARLIGRFGR
jgi:hypothetical protein